MKKLRLICIYMVLPAFLVCCLGYVTLRRDTPNGFLRKFKDESFAVKVAEAQFSNNITSICGIANHSIYFGTREPGWISAYNTDLTSSKLYSLGLQADERTRQFFKTKIDSSSFTIFAGNVPSIIKGKLSNPSMSNQSMNVKTLYTDIVEFRPGRFIIRAFDNIKGDFIFQKMDASGKVITSERNISIPISGGGITTQGTLLYDAESNRVLYIYRLFNKIQCFDTSLNLIYSVNTIDTIAHPMLQTSSISRRKGKFKTYGGAPLYTNYRATISDGFIFINSLVKADNEASNKGIKSIDVYDIRNGFYQYSFHLSLQKGRIDDLLIRGNNLYAINIDEKRILKYSFKEK